MMSAFSSFKSSCSVPGLFFIPDFLEKQSKDTVRKKVLGLYHNLIFQKQTVPNLEPRLSQLHNLASEAFYKNISFKEEESQTMSCQYFEKYGEEGHNLIYFERNENIPNFIKKELIQRILNIDAVRCLKNSEQGTWNFTLNTYAVKERVAASVMPGFPYHKDIESNGEITAIYSLGERSIFEIRDPHKPNRTTTLPLIENSLILLSGAARWDYEHRVISMVVDDELSQVNPDMEAIRRMSLVLGVNTPKETLGVMTRPSYS